VGLLPLPGGPIRLNSGVVIDLHERERWIVASWSSYAVTPRVTLSPIIRLKSVKRIFALDFGGFMAHLGPGFVQGFVDCSGLPVGLSRRRSRRFDPNVLEPTFW
jgi:hypothetical protein